MQEPSLSPVHVETWRLTASGKALVGGSESQPCESEVCYSAHPLSTPGPTALLGGHFPSLPVRHPVS